MCPPRLEVEHKRDRTAELKNFPSQSEPVLGLLKKKITAAGAGDFRRPFLCWVCLCWLDLQLSARCAVLLFGH